MATLEQSLNGIGVQSPGFIVWSMIQTGFRTHEQLSDECSDLGIEGRFIPKKLTPKNALVRAVQALNAWLKTYAGKSVIGLASPHNHEIVLDAITTVAPVYTYSLRHREILSRENTPYQQVGSVNAYVRTATFVVKRSVGVTTLTDQMISAIEAKLRDLIVEKSKFNIQEIRQVLSNFLDEYGVCLNAAVSGGVYYVPKDCEVQLRAIKRLMGLIDPVNDVTIFDVSPTSDSLGQLNVSLVAGIENDLGNLIRKAIADLPTAQSKAQQTMRSTAFDLQCKWEANEKCIPHGYATMLSRIIEVKEAIQYRDIQTLEYLLGSSPSPPTVPVVVNNPVPDNFPVPASVPPAPIEIPDEEPEPAPMSNSSRVAALRAKFAAIRNKS